LRVIDKIQDSKTCPRNRWTTTLTIKGISTRNVFYKEIFHECFKQKNTELVAEFDRYVREHPDFAERIPDCALATMLVEETKNSIGCGVKNGATRLKQHSLTPDFLS